ncbi:MAG: efflux RND transporter permease subunit, partial [Planctomycetota bacterium]
MRHLVTFCLSRPITTLTIHITLLVLGGLAITRLPLNALPEREQPRVSVTIPYPNTDPHQIEMEVTRPVEEALATLSGVEEITSESSAGRSRVSVHFPYGTNIDQVKMEVRERLARAKNDLPPEIIDDIRIRTGHWNSGDAIIRGRISSRGVDLSQNYELLVNRLRRPLERIEGVGQVEMDGVAPMEIQVIFRQDDLDRNGLRLLDVVRRLQDSNIDLTVGELLENGRLQRMRVLNYFGGIKDVRAFPVNTQGVRLDQVADVNMREGEMNWGRHLNRRYAVSLEVYKESTANTVETCERVKNKIAEMGEDPLLKGIDLLIWEDQGQQILDSLNGLKNAGLLGSLFAIV